MKIDLISDYKEVLLKKIKANPKLDIPIDMSEQKVIIKHIEYQRKIAFAGPHQIKLSQNFNCPNEFQDGYSKLKKIIEYGGDIQPYLNRYSLKFNEYDDLFADWGILHFHLGNHIPEGDKFVKRGEFVLFAYNSDDVIYFIDIYDHQHWSDREVIQEMYNNWPELIEPLILKGITAITPEISSEKRTEYRKKGLNALLTIKDNNGEPICLAPPGQGQTTARNSVLDVRLYDFAQFLLKTIEEQLKNQEEIILTDMKNNGIKSVKEPFLKLVDFNTQKIIIQDQNFKDFKFEIPIA